MPSQPTDAPKPAAVDLELDKLVEAGLARVKAAWKVQLMAAGEDCFHRHFDDRARSVTLTWKCKPDVKRQGRLRAGFFVTSKLPSEDCGERDYKVSADGTVRVIPDDDENQGTFDQLKIDPDTGEVLKKETKDGPTSGPRLSGKARG